MPTNKLLATSGPPKSPWHGFVVELSVQSILDVISMKSASDNWQAATPCTVRELERRIGERLFEAGMAIPNPAMVAEVPGGTIVPRSDSWWVKQN